MSWTGLKTLVPPAVTPETVAQAKEWLRIRNTAEDGLVGRLVRRAQRWIENKTGRTLITTQYLYTLDSFPPYDMSIWLIRQPRPYLPQTRQFQGSGGGTIRLPRTPLASVDQITFLDPGDGSTKTMAPSLYVVDTATEMGRVAPAYGQTWPVTRWQLGAVQVTFTAGYGSQMDSIPDEAQQCMEMLVAHWYENREATSLLRQTPVPFGLASLVFQLWPGEYN